MIDLYLSRTQNGLRASLALAESDLEHRIHIVDFATETKNPDFLALNPAGQVPLIVDSDGPGGVPLTLAQSGAILLYVAEKSGKLLPKDAMRRAVAYQWLMVGASDVSSANQAVFLLENEAPEKSAKNVEYFKNRLVRFFSLIDQRLSERQFLADELSIADLIIYPNYFMRKALVDPPRKLVNLRRWGEMMSERPGVKKGMNP